MHLGKIGKKSYLVPKVLYLTSYLLPPLSAKMQANAFKLSTGNTYVDASKIVQPRGTYLRYTSTSSV